MEHGNRRRTSRRHFFLAFFSVFSNELISLGIVGRASYGFFENVAYPDAYQGTRDGLNGLYSVLVIF